MHAGMTPGQLLYVNGLEAKVEALGNQVDSMLADIRFLRGNNDRLVQNFRTGMATVNQLVRGQYHMQGRSDAFEAFASAIAQGGKSDCLICTRPMLILSQSST